MITANMATYPAREPTLGAVLARLAPQVDVLNITLNEYRSAPNIQNIPSNVRLLWPPTDLKDTGKFYPRAPETGFVFYVDDDILYPKNYVEQTLWWFDRYQTQRCALGFHGCFYLAFHQADLRRLPKLLRTWVRGQDHLAQNRRTFSFDEKLDHPTVVDQLGTGTLAMRTENLPPFDYMRDSQKFVDVRLARWLFEKEITPICLPREGSWLQPIQYPETIYASYTRSSPEKLVEEIRSFALKRKDLGQQPPFSSNSHS